MLNVKKECKSRLHIVFFSQKDIMIQNNFPLKRVDIVFAVVRLQRVKGNMENITRNRLTLIFDRKPRTTVKRIVKYKYI